MKQKKVEAEWVIYHNPRCSKSRATLQLLRERGIEPRIVEYLQSPPSAAELKSILSKLKLKPAELLRTGEEDYRIKIEGRTHTDAELIAAMVDNPILIERPVVVHKERAVLGRPPENVLQLLR